MTEQEKQDMLHYPLATFLSQIGFKLNKYNKMCCPFHQEDTPSFSVNIDENYYHCFGCKAGGNIFNFVKKYKNMNFWEAGNLISEVTGLPATNKPLNKKHEDYKNLMTSHAIRYNKCLYEEQGEFALKYLRSRGITDETIKAFCIGFVPKDEFNTRKDLGNIEGRISFPIQDMASGKPRAIAMGYRTLKDILDPIGYDKNEDVKYMNDRNTIDDLAGVFTKGDCFYGYNTALEHIRKTRTVVVVEGYMDVVSMHQSGIKNVLGNMTSNFTDKMIDILARICDTVYLCLDNDEAGTKGVVKNIPKLVDKGLNVNVYFNGGGKDAADLCQKKKFVRHDVLNTIINGSRNSINMLTDKICKRYDDIVVKERIKALDIIADLLKLLPENQRKVHEDMIYKRLDIRR